MAIQSTALITFILIFIPLYIIYKPPKLVISYFQSRFPDVLFQVNTEHKLIALTIDDAPSPFTESILDILKANDASATFFVIGNQVPGNEAILRHIVEAGSELGNHAMHDEPSISLSSIELQSQIEQVDGYIDRTYTAVEKHRPAHYFRPGSGVFSQRLLEVATKAGHKTILGSIYPHDPQIGIWWLNAWHILSMARPGAVIICHDRRPWTIPMLSKIIPAMKRKGYRIVSVTEFLKATQTGMSF